MPVQKYNFEATSMSRICTVFVEKARFHLPVGVYAGEKVTGNEILFTARVTHRLNEASPLAEYVSYETIFNLMREITLTPGELLEEKALELQKRLIEELTAMHLTEIFIRAEKTHAPIPGLQAGATGVEIHWKP
jgi:dihydroneopterin aldolase